MASRASRPRLLSRFRQPRRRLARRRQQLPDPVIRDHRANDVLLPDESVIPTEIVAASRRTAVIDTMLIEPAAEIETETVVTL